MKESMTTRGATPWTLTPEELGLLAHLDSTFYGFLKLDLPQHAKLKALIHQTIKCLECILLKHSLNNEEQHHNNSHQQVNGNKNDPNNSSNKIDPRIYCKLGHLNLLIENYSKALSAYQKYRQLEPEIWKDVTSLYGLGLVYFHYAAHKWAVKLFRQVLYVSPGFIRSNEVHIRLGIIFKVIGDYRLSAKFFKLALADSRPCTLQKTEIEFHLAHLYQVQKKHKLAKEAYEKLLENKSISPPLKSLVYKQLGWMHHLGEAQGDKPNHQDIAVRFLKNAIDLDPTSGQSLYFLGRCYANLGKVHDAFISYRNSVDKAEANADTWCSIGVLYQQQKQPMDALQAYICAVQLDKSHSAAWTNLGILYENSSQPQDALKCYFNAVRGKGPVSSQLQDRVTFLQTQLASAPQPSGQVKNQLPCIEDAWNFPISQEMASRQSQQQQQLQRQQNTSQDSADSTSGKRPRLENDGLPPELSQPVPPLTPQQLQMMNYLQQSQTITPQQKTVLQQLQNQHRLYQLQAQSKQQNLNRFSPFSASHGQGSGVSPSNCNSSLDVPHHVNNQQQSSNSGAQKPFHQNGAQLQQQLKPSLTSSSSGPTLTASDLSMILERKEMTTKIAEDIINTLAQDANGSLSHTISSHFNNRNITAITPTNSLADLVNSSSSPTLTTNTTSSSSTMNGIKSEPSHPHNQLSPNHHTHPMRQGGVRSSQIKFSPQMTASQIFEAASKWDGLTLNLLSDDDEPPLPPDPPYPPLPRDKLLPATPSVFLENKKDAFSPQLEGFCLAHPIAVVRGLTSVLKIDLGLFSTKSLVEANPEHLIEIRTQMQQNPDENWDPDKRKMVWRCESHRSHTTIARYAHYQASSFQGSLKDEQEKGLGHSRDSDSDSNSSAPSKTGKRKKNGNFKSVKFGTNVDLSDEKKWRPQLQELMKLPVFTRVVSAGNMLSHVGHTILGMNTVQLYMKVPGCRTPGHQENNNFCSVNINIGPGDCEWFAVPEEYWGALQRLCDKNNINFLHGSWWPLMDDLLAESIPVYRFLQKPGDLVWVNAGCVHWVQAIGWCNNIAWNVGPLTHKQYKLSIERYEWNKLENYKSIVPMIHLTWNLAKNIKVAEESLFNSVRMVLMRTMRYTKKCTTFIKELGKDIRWHGKAPNEAAHYCVICELEVFNLLFVKEVDKKHVVHCLDCALKASERLEDFVVLQEFTIDELMEIYDNFTLQKSIPADIS